VVPRPILRPVLRRHASHALAAGLALGLAFALSIAPPSTSASPAGTASPAATAPESPAGSAVASAVPPPVAPPAARADEKLDRRGRTAFSGGYLALTPDFASPDGVYDLVIHFHGNTELVEESLGHAKIGAVFVPQNLGVGSAPYESRFALRGAFPELLDRVQAAMERRGLAHARLGRVALIAWSAGHAAVGRILEQPAIAERIDAVILLDGLHVGHAPGTHRQPALEQLAPYERFARWAAGGEKLFVITHSDIAPDGFVGAHDTTDLLLGRLGVLRYAGGEVATIPDIPAVEGVLSKRLRLPLEPLTLADRGRLIVRGYAGDQPEHHIYHLMEMASIALPDLAAWWARPRDASP
jgi:hypothetical protein